MVAADVRPDFARIHLFLSAPSFTQSSKSLDEVESMDQVHPPRDDQLSNSSTSFAVSSTQIAGIADTARPNLEPDGPSISLSVLGISGC
jgi:hypothetical protein